MADQFAVVPFTVSGTGTFDITSGKITDTVQAAVFIYSHTTTDGSNVANGQCGVGFWADDGDSVGEDRASVLFSQDGRTAAYLGQTSKWNDALIGGGVRAAVNGYTVDVEVVFDSTIAGGIRLNATTASTDIDGIAILFAGVSRADTRQFAPSTVSQHEDCGDSVQFQPDLLLVFGHDGTFSAGPTTHVGSANMNLGFVTGGGQVGALNYFDSGSPSSAGGYVASSSVPTSSVLSPTFSAVTFTIDSTGFDHIATAGSPDLCALAIKFADGDTQVAIDNFSAPASTGSEAYPVGFQPQIVLGQSTLISTEDSLDSSASASGLGLFAFDDTNEYAVSVWNTTGITTSTPTESGTRQGSFGLLTMDEDGVLAQQAASSVSATGFSLNFSTATSGLFTALAIGAALPALVVDETETITDGVAFFVHQALVVDEGMTIIDACVALQTNALLGRIQSGETLSAGVDRATALSSGATAGDVL